MLKQPVLLPKDEQKYAFQRLVQKHTPSRPITRNALAAFLTGGLITAVAQILFLYLKGKGVAEQEATALTSLAVLFFGSFLTGLGFYDEIGKVAGMGSALPISGFANSMTSPAMEFKREGWVLGVGAKMFTVAGPVIVFGLIVAALSVAIRWIVRGGS